MNNKKEIFDLVTKKLFNVIESTESNDYFRNIKLNYVKGLFSLIILDGKKDILNFDFSYFGIKQAIDGLNSFDISKIYFDEIKYLSKNTKKTLVFEMNNLIQKMDIKNMIMEAIC